MGLFLETRMIVAPLKPEGIMNIYIDMMKT